MSDQSRITVWERWDGKIEAWEHNHIESGWNQADSPTPVSLSQKKSWEKAVWRSSLAYLVDGAVKQDDVD